MKVLIHNTGKYMFEIRKERESMINTRHKITGMIRITKEVPPWNGQ